MCSYTPHPLKLLSELPSTDLPGLIQSWHTFVLTQADKNFRSAKLSKAVGTDVPAQVTQIQEKKSRNQKHSLKTIESQWGSTVASVLVCQACGVCPLFTRGCCLTGCSRRKRACGRQPLTCLDCKLQLSSTRTMRVTVTPSQTCLVTAFDASNIARHATLEVSLSLHTNDHTVGLV